MINFYLFGRLDVLPPPLCSFSLFLLLLFLLECGAHEFFVLKIRLDDVRAANTVNYEARGWSGEKNIRNFAHNVEFVCFGFFAIFINCVYECR